MTSYLAESWGRCRNGDLKCAGHQPRKLVLDEPQQPLGISLTKKDLFGAVDLSIDGLYESVHQIPRNPRTRLLVGGLICN